MFRNGRRHWLAPAALSTLLVIFSPAFLFATNPTLGNGVDPANASLGPGGPATYVDSFTFQTTSGTDIVTAVTVTLAAGTSAGLSLVEVTNDAGTFVYGTQGNPASDTVSISFSPTFSATTTSTQFRVRITPRSGLNMPLPPGSTYNVTAFISSWTGTGTQLGSDSGGTTVTIDNQSPGDVTASTATSGNTQVSLDWTNPSNPDLNTIIVMRRSGSAVANSPAEGSTYSIGNIVGSATVACVLAAPASSCTDTGLTNGTAYYYKIYAGDTNSNYSLGVVPSGSPVTPGLTTIANGADPANAARAPGGAATNADSFTFRTATGTDPITAATVTLAAGTSAGLGLVEITNNAGTTVYGSVANPASDTPVITLTTNISATTAAVQYRIRVTPKSHAAMPVPPGATYAVTAFISDWTGKYVHAGSDTGGTTVTIDNQSPGDVTASTATAGNTQVVLAWTNPADADLNSKVVLRVAGSPVADAPAEGATYVVGNTIGASTVVCVVNAASTTCTNSGLTNGTAYHYKIFAKDTIGNYATGAVPTGSPATPNLTTLATGADPSNAAIAPGDPATMADAFTFQDVSGTDAITSVTVTLAAGTFAGVNLVEITNDAGTIVYGTVTDPVSNSPAIPLTTNISVTSTATQYKIRVTPKTHANMPVPPGASYAVTALISNWTGTNVHAGSDTGGTTVTIDNLSPGNVTASTASAGNAQVSLTWTNPVVADLGTIIVLRRATSAVADTPTEGAVYVVGNTIGASTVACVVTVPTAACTDTGLINGTVYHYKIFTKDTNGNYAIGVIPAGSPVTPNTTTLADGTNPADASLAPGGVATMADAFTLQTALGTDTITSVTVTLAAGTQGGLSLVEITNDAGTVVFGTVANPATATPAIALTTNITATTTATQYKIRVTPRTHANMPVPPGLSYGVTALISNWTGTLTHAGSDSAGTTVTIDNLSPGNVTASTATPGNTQVTLAWTNPADADLGTIIVLRRPTNAVASTPVEGTTYAVGNTIGTSTVACVVTAPTATCTDTGLTNGTAYHYKLYAKDTNGNYATGVVPTGSPATPYITTVTNVTSSTANGTYGVGATVSIQVTFSQAVTVTGTPQLTLETGVTDAVVNYTSGSGTATLTFTYTVAAGQTSADLDYVATTALALNAGTIRDAGLNNATLTLAAPGAAGSLGANKALVIDGTAPTVTNVTSSTANGTYGVGAVVSVQVTFSEAVTVTGTPQLTLETGVTDAVVNYTSGSGTATLTFNYTVAAGHTSADLDYVATTSLALNAGTIRDAALNNATLTLAAPGAAGSLGANKALVIDTTAPTVTSVNSSTANGAYGVGAVVSVQVTFSEAVNVTGTPQLTLETGVTDAVVNYTSGSGTATLTFNYTVAAGHTSADLDYVATTSLALNAGTIRDAGLNNATLTLAAPGAAGSLGANKNLVIDTTAPTVTSVNSSTANGTYGVGAVVSVQVTFSEAVNVTGTPQLTLETGVTDAVVNYTSGSGTPTLTFNYTVAAGHTSADLDYVATTSLALNGGTIRDAGSNNATLTLAAPGAAGSLGANKALVIDGTAPTVTNVTSSTANGTYGVGTVIPVQVTFSEVVTVTGTPQLTLETGVTDAVVNYTSGSGTATLTFTYTVAAGQTSADLDYVATTALALNAGTIRDAGLNNATLTLAAPGAAGSLGANKALVIDGTAPTATNVTSSTANGTYGVGTVISVQVTFSEAVTVTGTPQLTLETGVTDAVVNYTSGSGTATLTFNYTVAAGHTSADLDYVATTSLALNAGTIRDAALNNATLTLAAPGAAGSLGANKALVIDTTAPTVTNVTSSTADGTYGVGTVIPVQVTFSEAVTVTGTPQLALETGVTDAVVNYTSGSGTPTLTFNYTVAAGHTSADLDYVATMSLALNAGTIRDAALNNATLTLAAPGAAGSLGANKALVIDTTAPTVTNVTSSTADGTYGVGATIAVTATFSEAVTVTGTPQLTLETGATDAVVNYSSGSGTPTLTFNYTVAAGHTSADLDYVATTSLALNGGTIRDAGSNNATLTLVAPGAAGSLGANKALVIDGTAPAVTSVTSSTANGTYGVGAVVSVQVAFSEAVIVTGTPQLTLETGATDAVVNYSSGSGTPTLTFNYTVAAGHTSADLDYVATTSLALNAGTIRDAGSNNVTLTLAAPGAAGSLGANKNLVIDTTAPTVTNVTSSITDGTYGVGAAISVQVTFSEAVTVTGTPQLTLETGVTDAVVNYVSGSGTPTLNFSYTVGAGQTTADLDYVATTSLALNGGTILDAGLNNATLTLAAPGAAGSLGANKNLVIDTTAPIVTNVTSSTLDGTYGVGATIAVSVTFSEAVTVTGTPQLTLETGVTDAVVNYTSGSGTSTLSFNYTVAAGHTTADLDYVATTSLVLNGGTIRDAGSNNATLTLAAPGAAGSLGANKALVIDTTAPSVTNVTSSTLDGTYGVGATIAVTVTFSEAVTVTGTPQLTLETGVTDAVVNYTSGSGTSTLSFNYTVAAGHTTADLDYVATTSLALNGGAIRDAGSNNTTLTLAAPGTAGSLGSNKNLVIDTTAPTVTNVTSLTANGTYGAGATISIQVNFSEAVTVTGTPQLTLETGATDAVVNYTSGSGSSTLTFNYTVAVGHTSADLDYVGTTGLALNSGTIRDAGANNATLTLAAPGAAGSLGANKAIVVVPLSPAVTVTPTSGLITTEAGGTATFTMVLTSQPTTNVMIPLSSSNPAEGTVSPASVTLTSANWNVPQTVTITGIDDTIADGTVAYTIVTGATSSGDPTFDGLAVADVSVSNTDNDSAGVTLTPISGLITTEAGGTATFTVALTSQPIANVTIPLTSSDLTEGTVSPASLTFTSANWNLAQTVTVTGVDDAVVDGNVAYTIVTGAAASTDPAYTGMAVADIAVTNTDNDTAGVTVTPTSGLITTEAGGTATFTVVLTSQPTANVTIPLTSSDLTEGTVLPASVTFTSANWNVAQTVTITGVDDTIVDGNIAYSIVTGAAASTDPIYNNLAVADVAVLNMDDDASHSDLSVTITNNVTTVTSSDVTHYIIIVTNNGPASVTGALLTDPAVAGLTKTSITCSGPAGCPASLSIAALEGAGIAVGTLGNLETVSFDVAATITAANGSVSNTAVIAVPTGFVDPVPANNSATDTDSVEPRPDIFVQVTSSTSVIELGDTLTYAVRIENRSGPTLPHILATDRLPRGFRYLPGSALLSTDYGPPAPMPDPIGSPGPVLTFSVPAQPLGDGAIVSFRVRVGPGALQGTGLNIVDATALNGTVHSNTVQTPVVISGGVFTPEACVIGKVFADENRNHIQDKKELGIPGVHLIFEDGTILVSDVEGKYSYCGLTPTTHVLKVDRTTLPAGAQLTVSSNRNAGDANSLFVDLKYGEIRRADFIEGSRDPKVLAEIIRRRSQGEAWVPSFQTPKQNAANFADHPEAETRGKSNQTAPLILSAAPAAQPVTQSEPVMLGNSYRTDGSDGGPLDISTAVLGMIRLSADRAEAPADGTSVINLTMQVFDREGHSASTPLVATIEVSGGRLKLPDSIPAQTSAEGSDSDAAGPGTKLHLENGVGVVQLTAPGESQNVHVRVSVDDASTGAVSVDGDVTFVPRMRPFVAVGIFEGMMAHSSSDASTDSALPAHEAFDSELQHFAQKGDGYLGGRSAMFLKGTVLRDYLLTLSYDSDKAEHGVLFRDIQPEAFYPIYGDASLKVFDAQTSGKFYVRAERGRSYMLYGDFQTVQSPTVAQDLGLYRRTMTGFQQHLEKQKVVLNIFGSHDSLTQVIDEIAGLGISGPYSVSNTSGVSGTEKIEILTRDRNQPAVILSAVAMTRFTDYEFEPFNGRLVFRRPVPAVDELLNPVSIRVTYEVDRGGDKAWIGGVDGHVNLGRFVQVGGSFAKDGTAGAPYQLGSVNGFVKLGKSTTLVAEGAQTSGTVNTTTFNQSGLFNLANEHGDVDGTAGRIELRHESRRVGARLFAGSSSSGFNNPASTLTGGRSELSGHASFTVTRSVRLVGEAIRSEDKLTDGHREGALLSLETRLTKSLGFEFGVRRAKESVNPAQGTSVGTPLFSPNGSSGTGFGFSSGSPNIDPDTGLPIVNPGFAPQLSADPAPPQTPEALDVLTVRAKATLKLSDDLTLYAEGEQDVRDANKNAAAVGGQFHLTERTRLYLRHEFISSMGSPYALSDRQSGQNTVFGISSTFLKNTDAFNEYRMRDSISGREAEAAIGLRNLWKLAEGVNVSTSVERLNTFAGVDHKATAATAGFEYTRSPLFKSTERLEWRRDDISESWISTIGLARKISRDWSLLSKNYFQQTAPLTGPSQLQNRFWIGGAYRQTDSNRLNVLTRYEFRYEDGLPQTDGTTSRRDVHTVSTHADWHPVRTWNFSGQYAAKRVKDSTVVPDSPFLTHLISGRIGHDVSKRIDLGLLGSTMWSPAGGGRQSALGAEAGYLVHDNMWVSVGYNFSGFSDRDLTSSNETSRGVFVRFRLKFDEDLFGRGH